MFVFIEVIVYFLIYYGAVAQFGRALRSQRRGRQFDPDQLHEIADKMS
jgi:hypothetical protein